MRVLGIESSCDECSLAVVEDGVDIKSLVVYSQLAEHRAYGGVVPELASRVHVQYIYQLYEQLCEKLAMPMNKMSEHIDGIAVTVCPGLSGSLLVGHQFAKGLSLAWKKPIIGIDHIQGHFYSAMLEEKIEYPYIGVVVSGGHTLFAIVHDYETLEIKGASIDDACGEAFEKIARELGLAYPGGPEIERLAKNGNPNAADFPVFSFKKYGYNVSYSGLKTAVLHHRKKYWNNEYEDSVENISASFQRAAVKMITDRVSALVVESGIKRVALGGGVACNAYLKSEMQELANRGEITQLVMPSPVLCADNAAMIAGLGYEYLRRGKNDSLSTDVSARAYRYKGYTRNISP